MILFVFLRSLFQWILKPYLSKMDWIRMQSKKNNTRQMRKGEIVPPQVGSTLVLLLRLYGATFQKQVRHRSSIHVVSSSKDTIKMTPCGQMWRKNKQ